MSKAKEAQNQVQFDQYRKMPIVLGPYTSFMYRTDPKHLGFLFARYKFVSKMLQGKKNVLEVGCGDGFGAPVVASVVEKLYCTDFETLLMEDNRKRLSDYSNIEFSLLDITKNPFRLKTDAVYSLDVLEHIPPEKENNFFINICKSMAKQGICIIGSPNSEAVKHASEKSRMGHINLKNYMQMQSLLNRFFINGFIFSMNDEIVHTGYYPMAHYLIMLGIGVKGK
jgi:cyclopropane fatty-acyl-phospholipid synthase-like methyltransferase